MKKIKAKDLLKWLPVALVAVISFATTLKDGIDDQKMEDRIDSMDERIRSLENGES